MDKLLDSFLLGAVAVLKGPLIALLLLSAIISLVRHPHGPPLPAHSRKRPHPQ